MELGTFSPVRDVFLSLEEEHVREATKESGSSFHVPDVKLQISAPVEKKRHLAKHLYLPHVQRKSWQWV